MVWTKEMVAKRVMGDSNTIGWASFPNHNLHGITRKHLPDKVDLEQRKDEINEDLFAAAWIDLEIVILSEVCQAEKDNYHMISHMESKTQYEWTYM